MIDTLFTQTLDHHTLSRIRQFVPRIAKFGCRFYVFSQQGDCLFSSVNTQAEESTRKIYNEISMRLCCTDSGKSFTDHVNGFVVADIKSVNDFCATAVVDCRNISDDHSIAIDLIGESLGLFVEGLSQTQTLSSQIEMISGELAQTYEELVLLYKMSTNMKVTNSESNYLQMACDNLTELVKVEGIGILLQKEIEGVNKFVLTAGSGIIRFDDRLIDVLELAVSEELAKGNEIMIDSDHEAGLKYNWPSQIRNIVAVPLNGKDNNLGIMVAVNRIQKEDFDSIDTKLFNSVAHECAVFIENGKLIKDLKDLFIGALKSLTNSIDAKDQYTRGHSERVAFISRWIAEKLMEHSDVKLTTEQVHQIYLAGLLHDIGKIGIDEKVLRKKGALEDDEFKQIQVHPSTGAAILADIKQMKEIIPGVLCHHERVDGRGYPAGLKGDQIPLIGKIISVADSFDAMISKRIYRDAMNIKKALSEIEKGIGTQFDETVARVFLDSNINQLWNIIQDGFIERWDYSNFSEFGVDAVGTLLK